MKQLQEYMDGLPNICGWEDVIEHSLLEASTKPQYLPESQVDFGHIRSAAAVALHMHQPLIPAGGDDMRTAELISNLQYMMEHQDVGDNHNAPKFAWCYKRMGEIIPQLIHDGKEPRIMLDYSGTLLHGMRKMGLNDVFDNLKRITCDPYCRHAVEWLGAPWGHSLAPSTPAQDYRLHVRAWQHHFAAIFGLEALARVRGFSPSEMALPNHPDVAYEFVKTLKDCGYTWVLVQEHTVEQPMNGAGPELKHIPHRLVCRNSRGESASIVAIVKTQNSDTKLVAQMQPYYEAKDLSRRAIGGVYIPPLVTQIADGENGGVMMNEFPDKYIEVVRESSATQTPLMNCTEYLEHMFAAGVGENDLPVLQPLLQKRIWDRFETGSGPARLAAVIKDLEREDDRFHMLGHGWTDNISWVVDDESENLLEPSERASAHFHKTVLTTGVSSREGRYRNALFHLMAFQSSCYRNCGAGLWTDYGREIFRRLDDILLHDYPGTYE